MKFLPDHEVFYLIMKFLLGHEEVKKFLPNHEVFTWTLSIYLTMKFLPDHEVFAWP
jgi:hypothetical protein